VRQAVVDASGAIEAPLVGEVLSELDVPTIGASPPYGLTFPLVTAETAGALIAAETVLADLTPSVVVLSGSSDAAVAWALTATKLKIPVARLDAGLRDFDWNEPRDVNRVLMDTMADTLFAPTADAADNLIREGVGENRILVTGCTAVDSLRGVLGRARARQTWRDRGLAQGAYVLVTLGRPSNLEDDERLARIVEAIAAMARDVPVVLLLGARNRERLETMGDVHRLLTAGVRCEAPLSYLDRVSLQSGAGAVLTDSGTMQDESSVLGIPCFTLRATTDRCVTLTHGTNVLLGTDPRDIADVRLRTGPPTPCAIPLWDGRSGARIARELIAAYALVRASRAS
jgi:UDP-N-acetylglucosamine 2-epimerase (non-hydrolysing)